MRIAGKIIPAFTALLLLAVLFSVPLHTHRISRSVKPDLYIYSAELNVSETGLPYGSSWGFFLNDLNNSANNQGQYVGSPQSFSTYMDLFDLTPGNYSVDSVYVIDNSIAFQGHVGNFTLKSGANHVCIHFYEVNISTVGLPQNSSLILMPGPYGIEQTMPSHNLSIYMPNGTYSFYAGARDYYSWSDLSFTVNGSSTSTNITFVRCYRITFNWESQAGTPLNLHEGLFWVNGLLDYTAYDGVQINSTFISYMVPNGTYNITVESPVNTFRTSEGITTYMQHVNLVSGGEMESNVTGAPLNYNISFQVTYTPVNVPAKLYTYSPEIAAFGIATAALLYFAFFRKRRR